MAGVIDDYILGLDEDKRYDYLLLHQFVMSCSDEIVEDKKFNSPFYTCHGLLLYIHEDKKQKQFYFGFCNGFLINDHCGILDKTSGTSMIAKWYFKDQNELKIQSDCLKDLILQSIEVNKSKGKSKI